jgi:protein-disulfide isomerase
MDSFNASQSATPKKHSSLKMLVLVFSIVLLCGGAYIASLTLKYYQQLATGTVDLHSFEKGGQTTVSGQQSVGTIRNSAAENFADDPSIGPADAKLTVVLFEDFQCPFCRQQFTALRTAIAKYSDSVRFVYRDFPISDKHPDAAKAAEAGGCANEQGQFWAYHDKLFLNADHLSVTDLKTYALQLHLDAAKFNDCLDSGKYTAEVNADFQDGLEAGVTGTPTFFFNGNRVAGVLNADGFDQIISYLNK